MSFPHHCSPLIKWSKRKNKSANFPKKKGNKNFVCPYMCARVCAWPPGGFRNHSDIDLPVVWTSWRAHSTVRARTELEVACTALPVVCLDKLKLSNLPRVTQHICASAEIHILLFTAIVPPLVFISHGGYQVHSNLRDVFSDIPALCLKDVFLLSTGCDQPDPPLPGGLSRWVLWQKFKDPAEAGQMAQWLLCLGEIPDTSYEEPVWFCCLTGGGTSSVPERGLSSSLPDSPRLQTFWI